MVGFRSDLILLQILLPTQRRHDPKEVHIGLEEDRDHLTFFGACTFPSSSPPTRDVLFLQIEFPTRLLLQKSKSVILTIIHRPNLNGEGWGVVYEVQSVAWWWCVCDVVCVMVYMCLMVCVCVWWCVCDGVHDGVCVCVCDDVCVCVCVRVWWCVCAYVMVGDGTWWRVCVHVWWCVCDGACAMVCVCMYWYDMINADRDSDEDVNGA